MEPSPILFSNVDAASPLHSGDLFWSGLDGPNWQPLERTGRQRRVFDFSESGYQSILDAD